MVVLVTCKNEDDPNKNEVSRTQYIPYYKYGIFSNDQGQLTPQFVVDSGRNSNSPEMLWLSSLPARLKKIRSKSKGARVLTRLYVAFSDAQASSKVSG